MSKHTKPTKEELQANAMRALEEAENMASEAEPVVVPQEDQEETFEPEKPAEVIEPEKKTEVVVEPESTKPEKVEPKKETDYKEKFSESTREAQILYAKNKKTTELLEKASQLPEPTDEELKALYKDWDIMGDFERQMAKENFMGKRYREFIAEGTKEFKDIEAWTVSVDEFIEDPATLVKNPELEGKQEAFKVFASKPTRRGVDFEDLVSAFLFDVSKTTRPVNKGSMFETGSGGPNDKPSNAPKKLTPEQGSALRKQNYRLWLQYSREGKIDND